MTYSHTRERSSLKTGLRVFCSFSQKKKERNPNKLYLVGKFFILVHGVTDLDEVEEGGG